MKTISFLLAVAAFILVQPVGANKYSQLKKIEGYNFQVYYSQDCDERAKLISHRVDKAINYFEKLPDFNASVTLLVLSADDLDEIFKLSGGLWNGALYRRQYSGCCSR